MKSKERRRSVERHVPDGWIGLGEGGGRRRGVGGGVGGGITHGQEVVVSVRWCVTDKACKRNCYADTHLKVETQCYTVVIRPMNAS